MMSAANMIILNGTNSSLQYLPYGVTTLEMNLVGDTQNWLGYLYPYHRAIQKYKHYCGFPDKSENFLVIWGGGNQRGLYINRDNWNMRLFLQILHCGDLTSNDEISFLHDQNANTVKKLRLIPVDVKNPIRMDLKETNNIVIQFVGSMMPIYYSRWFPPRPSQGENITYRNVIPPAIEIKFSSTKDKMFLKVKSDVHIYLEGIMVATITGDWHHSCFHAELFTVTEDNRFLVLRCWFIWLHKDFSKNPLLGLPHTNQATERNFLLSKNIEYPDIERFDFLIDKIENKIKYMGTDFHYQELWYLFENVDIVRAKIAGDLDTLPQVIVKLKNRVNRENAPNPMDVLKNRIIDKSSEDWVVENEWIVETNFQINSSEAGKNVTHRGRGFLRKHIPFATNGKPIGQLISSVVTA